MSDQTTDAKLRALIRKEIHQAFKEGKFGAPLLGPLKRRPDDGLDLGRIYDIEASDEIPPIPDDCEAVWLDDRRAQIRRVRDV